MQKIRVVIYLDGPEYTALLAIIEKTGACMTELCRRAIKEWLKRQKV